MFNKHLHTINYVLISISLHIFILLLMGVYFIFFSTPINIGSMLKETIVSSYMATDHNSPETINLQSSSSKIQNKILHEKIALSGLIKTKESQHKVQSTANAHEKITNSKLAVKSDESRGENTTELLTLLHSAIQAQQRYPMIAQQMEREGRVTIKFKLFTNGTIDHLQIVNSSGTDSLDQAALLAVNAAVPFKHIEKYIKIPQEYTVDIVFRLN